MSKDTLRLCLKIQMFKISILLHSLSATTTTGFRHDYQKVPKYDVGSQVHTSRNKTQANQENNKKKRLHIITVYIKCTRDKTSILTQSISIYVDFCNTIIIPDLDLLVRLSQCLCLVMFMAWSFLSVWYKNCTSTLFSFRSYSLSCFVSIIILSFIVIFRMFLLSTFVGVVIAWNL
jgi:hypothetical protein